MCVNISRKGEEGEECRHKDRDGHGKWVGVDLEILQRESLFRFLGLWFEICFAIYESSPEHAITNVKS